MMLLDSNIVIYAAKPEYSQLREFIVEHSPAFSAISYVEVLGYHKLTDSDRTILREFFSAALVLPVSAEVIELATQLRQKRKMTLGDALIAGTALISKRTLVTRNTKDFVWIDGLVLLDPLQDSKPSLTELPP